MSNQKYDFTGKSIRCETWEQMLHLAGLAEGEGFTEYGFTESGFIGSNEKLFEVDDDGNFSSWEFMEVDKTEISYSDFINIIPNAVLEVTGCEKCMFNVFNDVFELPECRHPSQTNNVIRLVSTKEALEIMFADCPLKKSSLTIKLKCNDTTSND